MELSQSKILYLYKKNKENKENKENKKKYFVFSKYILNFASLKEKRIDEFNLIANKNSKHYLLKW